MSDIILTREDKANLFDILWTNSLVGLAEVNKDNFFIKVNQVFCDLIGYNEPELLGKTWLDITHEDDIEGDLKDSNKVIVKEKKSYGMAKRYRHKFGHHIKVHIKVIGYYGSENEEFKIFLVQAVPSSTHIKPKTEEEIRQEIKRATALWRENVKWLAAAFSGVIVTAIGTLAKDTIVQTAGLGIMATTFGVFTVANKDSKG